MLQALNVIDRLILCDGQFEWRQDEYSKGVDSSVCDAATFAWIDQGFGFAVTAMASRDELLPIAEAVYKGLTPKG